MIPSPIAKERKMRAGVMSIEKGFTTYSEGVARVA